MKIKLNNPYGYKVCYSIPKRKRKLIDKVHTNTYGLAQFEKRRYEKISEDCKNPLYRATWYIVPIKKREYNKIWGNCPF